MQLKAFNQCAYCGARVYIEVRDIISKESFETTLGIVKCRNCNPRSEWKLVITDE